MRYLKLRKRGGGFVGVPTDPPPYLSSERVGGETFTLVSVPLLDTDFEVTNSVEDIINALGAEVAEPSVVKNGQSRRPSRSTVSTTLREMNTQ